MTATRTHEVVVLGNGPAAVAVAAILSSRGVDTAITRVPPAVDHELLVGRASLDGVAASVGGAGIDVDLPASEPSVRLVFGPGRSVVLPEPGLLRLSMVWLQRWLLELADRTCLTELPEWAGTVERSAAGWRIGFEHSGDEVGGRHLVVATGSAPPPLPTSGAVRLTGGAAREDGLAQGVLVRGLPSICRPTYYVLPPPPDDARSAPVSMRLVPRVERPSHGWLTITRWSTPEGALRRDFAQEAVSQLRALDRLSVEPVPGVPTLARRIPMAVAGPALEQAIAIGASARLTNRFTGDGVDHALVSAAMAADAIAQNRDDPVVAARTYSTMLAGHFTSERLTGGRAARRYHLSWRMLADSADVNTPFFAKGRRALFLPGGMAGLLEKRRLETFTGGSQTARVAPLLLACDELALRAVEDEWPFLAAIISAEASTSAQPLRPAALFGAAVMAGGRHPSPRTAYVAAAIELGMLGALALLDPQAHAEQGRGVNWPVATAIMASDFLLARASLLLAGQWPELVTPFAEWLSSLAQIRARGGVDMDHDAGSLFATMLEFPARIGAGIGGASPARQAALRAFGSECGRLFALMEDLLALTGRRTRTELDLGELAALRLSTLPPDVTRRLTETGADRALSDATRELVSHEVDTSRRRALALLGELPEAPPRLILQEYLDMICAP